MNGHKKAVLFDLDGTLIDTAPEMHLAVNVLLEEEGLKPLPYESVRPHVSNGVMGIFKNILKTAPKWAVEDSKDIWTYMRNTWALMRKLFPA